MLIVSLGPFSVSSGRMSEACHLCTCKSCAQLRQSLGFARLCPVRLVDALHLFHEHCVRSVCSKQLAGLGVTILAQQFSSAENKMLLLVWVSDSRGKGSEDLKRSPAPILCLYLRPNPASAAH